VIFGNDQALETRKRKPRRIKDRKQNQRINLGMLLAKFTYY